MRIKRRQKTLDIPHPHDESFVVTVHRRKRIESLRDFEDVLNSQRVEVLTHPKTGEVLRDDDGEPNTKTVTAFSVNAIHASLEKVIKGWTGLEEEDGEGGPPVEIPYTKENLDYLFEPEFDVKEKNDEGKEESTPFWQYITRELAGGNPSGPLAAEEDS